MIAPQLIGLDEPTSLYYGLRDYIIYDELFLSYKKPFFSWDEKNISSTN